MLYLAFSVFLLALVRAPQVAAKEPISPVETAEPDKPENALFYETFLDPSALGNRWIFTKGRKGEESESGQPYDGKWEINLPQDVLLKGDLGLIMKSPAHHHALSAKLSRVFQFKTSSLVVQYDIKFQDQMECGGGYVKLVSHQPGVDLNYFSDKTPFTIMFGPDKCGLTSKIHLIVRHRNPITGVVSEHAADPGSSNTASIFQDKKVHLLTLVMNPDDSYYVYLDQSLIMSGNLLKDLSPSIIPPTEIDDPEDKKPADWDEREKIPDLEATKPDDWNEDLPEFVEDVDAVKPKDWYEDEPEFIQDASATQPKDWDKDMDGEWEAPMIANPKCAGASGCGPWKRPTKKNPLYKGKWTAPMVPNPNYQGKWAPRKIANPNYFQLENAFTSLEPITAIGLELWTMTPEVIFDNFLVTTSESEAKTFAAQTWKEKIAAEALRDDNVGFIHRLIKETETKPWLWAVYAVAILLPTVLFVYWCFGGKKLDKKSHAKKYDTITEDDDDEAVQDTNADYDGTVDLSAGEVTAEEFTDDEDEAEISTPERRNVRRED